jgi:hypothetical protein
MELGSLAVRLYGFPGVQALGQSETQAKSTNKKVNGDRAAENAGQESRPLRTVKNRFLTKDRHSLGR